MIPENGAPQNREGRQARELATYDLLQKLNIPYLRVDHAPAATMEDCTEIDASLGVTMCKNLFLCNTQKTKFYLVMLPGEKKFSSKDFSRLLGIARVSFAPPEAMEKYLNILPGAVSVMGLANDTSGAVSLVIDSETYAGEYLGCHPCVNTSSIRISMKDLTEKFLPAVGHRATVLTL